VEPDIKPPGLQVSVDLLNDQVNTTLSGQDKMGQLSIVVNGPAQQTLSSRDIATVGSYSDSLKRTSLGVGQYGTVIATWDTLSVSVPLNFYVIGNTRFSQYNVPYENQCPQDLELAWIINKIDLNAQRCDWREVTLSSEFVTQTSINGTGVSNAYGVLKSYGAGARNVCPLPPPASTDGSDTFFSVDTGGAPLTKVTGSCNKVLSDGSGSPNSLVNSNPMSGTLAAFPAPAGNSMYACSDQILMVDQHDNAEVRTIQDTCPACKGGYGASYGNTVAHIDTFNSSPACRPHDTTDYGNRVAIRLR